MRVKYFSVFIIIWIVIFITACEYSLTEEYKSSVKPTDPASILVRLNPEESSYVLTGTSNFSCEAITEGLNIYSLKVFVDSVEITTYGNDITSFFLYCKDYSEGIHALTVTVSTNSCSGSIADVIGAEGFIFSGTWELIVDKSPPEPVQITNISNSGGILKIEWEKYSKRNFYMYVIEKTYIGLTGGYPQTETVGFVLDSMQTYYCDSTYVGGWSEYKVIVVTPLYLEAESEPRQYDDPAPDFKVEWIEEDVMKLSWARCNYPKAFRQYRLSLDYDTVITVDNINTTSLTGHFGVLGDNRNFQLEVLTVKEYQFTGVLTSRIQKGVGIPFMKYESFLKNSVTDDLLISNSQRLFRYNPASGQFLDSIEHPLLLPAYILSPANDIMLTAYTPIKSIDPVTLNVTPGQFKNYLKNFSNASYGLAILGTGMCIYDFRNNIEISAVSILPYNDKYISGDNKYLLEYDDFLNQLECFQIGNNQLSSIWTVNAVSYFLIPQRPEILLTCSDHNFEVRNMSTGQTILTIPVNSWTSIQDVDPDAKIVVLYTSMDEKLYLYNYETGSMVRSFDASYTDYYLMNNVLYSSKGFKLPLAI